ncbi:probable L-gulonolactone oxidase 4 [Euphorbia lathyris]|uniref:probable L-gulonolactone oxidase 4 n=1 Tax=Euphorbia lathyris TaxID=212925 RepID=UPI0033138A96
MCTFRRFLRSSCLFLFISAVQPSPPEDHIKCNAPKNTNCTITNSYGTFPDRTICKAGATEYPTTEEELIGIIAKATKEKRKMKVATRYSHSIPKLVCPDGEDGLLISTKNLDKVLEIDAESSTMTVQSGVTLRQIINEGAKAGLALPYGPYWWGLTIGGMMSTGAHGSSVWGNGSAVHDYVVSLTMVSPGGIEDGYVKVRRLRVDDDDDNSEMNAAKVSLGVLGVISKVSLKMEPLFKRSITYVDKNDSDLGDEAVSFGYKHEFADVSWYPSQHKAVYRIDDRHFSNNSANGLYDSIPFRSTSSLGLALIRTSEESQESLGDAEGKCISARLVTTTLLKSAYGLTNNGIVFTRYPVIGYQNKLQSSGTCLDSHEDALVTACPWDPRIKGEYFHQTTFSIRMSDVKNFIQDVQQLVQLSPKALCVLEQYNGILMRYVKASSAYLGKQEDGIDFDFTYYRSKDPMNPRLYQDMLEEIEQIAVFKYQALPHWGKNRNVAFDGAIRRYKKAGEFLKVKKKYDLSGLFSSEWTDQVLGLKGNVSIIKEGCALEGLCICSEDVHCAPKKGYLCRPGKIYKSARVCSLVTAKKSVD